MNSKNQFFSLLFIALLVISCTKEDEPTPVASINTQVAALDQGPSPPSFSGQEFLFEDLSWQYYHSGNGSPWWDEIYLTTPPNPDLFRNLAGLHYNNTLLNVEVSIKFDTSSNWTKVVPDSEYDVLLPVQFTYIVYSPNLFVNVWPLNHHLVGRKAALKVKFL